MEFGIVFPQTEIGADPSVIRDYVQAAEELGYSHLVVFDHVLGADGRHHTGLPAIPGYRLEHMFHEPFVLFGYMAAITTRIGLVSSVLILGQRQTALVAKQAAEVDVLTGGRLRLGIGIGWNYVEYDALGENFHDRGRRSEEQIELMRALWTQEAVDFEGRWHKVIRAGINPLPVQRPIPIWLGGGGGAAPGNRGEGVLRRVGRLADGWMPSGLLQRYGHDQAKAVLDRLWGYAREAGRDPSAIGIEGRGSYSDGLSKCVSIAKGWKDLGATHYSVNTMDAGLKTPQDHIDAIRKIKEAVEV